MKNSELITKRFKRNITGALNCFDRMVLFETWKTICYPQAMSWHIHKAGIRLVDYEKSLQIHYVCRCLHKPRPSRQKKASKLSMYNTSVRKEAFASEILTARGDAPEIVCILSAMESCRCFKFQCQALLQKLQYRISYRSLIELYWD